MSDLTGGEGKGRRDVDRELTAQGAANIVSGALGGLPVSGVIVRTTTNVQAGARSRWSTVLHGLWVLLFVTLAFSQLITLLPMASLAALLVFIGVQMVNLGHVRNLRSHREMPIYFGTMAGVVLIGLAEGVAIGLALAAVLALRRLTKVAVHVELVNERWRVVVTGSLTFICVPRLTQALTAIPAGGDVDLDLKVDFMDNGAFEALRAWRTEHERSGGTVEIIEFDGEWYSAAANGIKMAPVKSLPSPERWWLPWAYRGRSAMSSGQIAVQAGTHLARNSVRGRAPPVGRVALEIKPDDRPPAACSRLVEQSLARRDWTISSI